MPDAASAKLWYMRRLNLFAGMDEATIEAVAKRLTGATVRRGQVLVREGQPDDQVFLVKNGAIRLFRRGPEGRELTTAIVRPGQIFGTASVVGVGDPGVMAEAIEPSFICQIGTDQFLRIVCDHALLASRVISTLALQVLRLEQQLERMTFLPVSVRLAQLLLQLAEDNAGQLPKRLTHDELAKLSGATRATVTRTLRQFAEAGLVELGYRHLAITDPTGLRREAGLAGG